MMLSKCDKLWYLDCGSSRMKEIAISKYLKNIFDGKVYNTQYYSLDAVISVGYRVKFTESHSVQTVDYQYYPSICNQRLCDR